MVEMLPYFTTTMYRVISLSTLLGFLLLGFSVDPTSSSTCGISLGKPLVSKIVGGYDVGYYKYPWFANLMYPHTNAPNCGATLIAPKWVLTAAHCYKQHLLLGKNNTRKLEDIFELKIGVNNRCHQEDHVENRRIKRVIAHEKYVENIPYYDIALLELEEESEHMPVCLPEIRGSSKTRGKEAYVQGVGVLHHDIHKLSCVLREARVLIYTDKVCRKMLMDNDDDGDDNFQHAFCAGYLQGGIDACQGDSGGPLLVVDDKGRHVLLGITAFGYNCAKKGSLGVYTDVSHFLGWIRGKIMEFDEGGYPDGQVVKPDGSSVSEEGEEDGSTSLSLVHRPFGTGGPIQMVVVQIGP